MARNNLDWIIQAVREGRMSNGAALKFASAAIAAAAGDPPPDEVYGDFSVLWPPKTAEEADRRRKAEAAARNARNLSDDELLDLLFPRGGEA